MASTTVDWTDPALTGQPRDATIERDKWGRYRIPDPETGKIRSWTRATTMAGTLADRFGLEQWSKRNVVLGLGTRADLYAQAASCTPDDKDTLNRIVEQAEEASKSKAGANLGTALHRFTERLDAGEQVSVPDPWAADVAAYRQTMTAAGVAVVDGWLERVLVIPQIGCAGTCDRLVNAMGWRLPRIGDLKTGQDVLRYSMVEIALQLAIYAHATHWYDPATRRLHEMPAVDLARALVMHLPVGQGVCHLYEVDIDAGWNAVELAVAVREWRKRKDLADQLPVIGTTETAAAASALASDERLVWLRGRIEVIKTAGHIDELALTWPVDTPTLKQGGLTDAHVDAIAHACDQVETAHRIPFPEHEDPFKGFDQQPDGALTQAVTEARVPQPTAQEWTQRARALIAPFDEQVRVAIAECAGAVNRKMTRRLHDNVAAIVAELGRADGVVIEQAGGPAMWVIVTSDTARDRLAAVHGNEISALAAAKQQAKALGLPVPRSLKGVVEQPLLAAVTAAAGTSNP